MKLLEKILFATDFSTSAEEALQTAILVARTFNSEITLIHVVPDIQDPPIALDMVIEAANNKIQELGKKIEALGVKVGQSLVKVGSVFEQIIIDADCLDVNVIMICSKGMTEDNSYKLGVTAERIIQNSDKPVWVVKKGGVQSITKILCPVDFSKPSHRALANAIHLARHFNAELTVLTVIQPLSNFSVLTRHFKEDQETYRKKQQARSETFLKEFNFHNVNWHKMTSEGKPSQEILNIAQEISSDLLIMGTTGKTGPSRVLMGHVTEKVTREMPCSMITFKSEHAIRLQLEKDISDLEMCFKQGKELLEKGFTMEAEEYFRKCLDIDELFAPAWEGLAAVREQQGQKEKAHRCIEEAKQIRQRLWEQKVEFEVRSKPWLFKK